jgi:hypothetical protein
MAPSMSMAESFFTVPLLAQAISKYASRRDCSTRATAASRSPRSR